PGDRRRGGRSLLGRGRHGVRAPGRRPYRLQVLAGKGLSTSRSDFHVDIRAPRRYSSPDFFGWKSGGLGGRGEMAVYTVLDKRELAEVVEDHGLVKLLAAQGIAAGSVNTTYLLETARGKHLLRVDYLQNYLETKLPKGIIHGDLFHDNLIVKGDKVVAVLDFEAASRGKFIFDLATAVNALCFDGEGYNLKRFEALIAGYESLRAL